MHSMKGTKQYSSIRIAAPNRMTNKRFPPFATNAAIDRQADGIPKPLKGKSRYMPGLDGLRALAVFAVIFYHLDVGWAPGGFLGVGVFFVLSGYLITDILLAQWKRNGQIDWKDFWLRRVRRLMPALLIVIAAVMTWITLFDCSQLASLRGDSPCSSAQPLP